MFSRIARGFRDEPFHYSLLVFTVLLPFLRLEIGEIQSWDESLYLTRALACIKYGLWLDQTSKAIGGLYSSSHPPVMIWLMASCRLISDSPFFLRLPSAIAASFAVGFLYGIARQFYNRTAAFVAAVSFGTAQSFLWFSQHAQLDSGLLCFSLGTAYFSLLSTKENKTSNNLLVAIFWCCALLSKFLFALAFLPLIVLTPLILTEKPQKKFLIYLLAGTLPAIAWYSWMWSVHPDLFTHAENIASSNTYDTLSNKAWWYYVNQLLINLPLIGFCVAALLTIQEDRRTQFFACWLFALLIMLQLMQTKMPHFTLLLLPAGALLIAAGTEQIQAKRKLLLPLVFLSTLSIGLSTSEQLRLVAKNELAPASIIWPHGAAVCIAIAALFLIGLVASVQQKNAVRALCFLCAVIVVVQCGRMLSREESVYNDGAEIVAEKIEEIAALNPNISNDILIASNSYPHELLAPQLAYYSNGQTIGWDRMINPKLTTYVAASDSVAKDPQLVGLIIQNKPDRFARLSQQDSLALQQLLVNARSRFHSHLRTRSYQFYY